MDWIQNIKENRENALKQIYSSHRTDGINFLYKNYKLNEEEAKDIFQTSIIILYENIFDGKLTKLTSDIKTYLFGIMKNQALVLLKLKNKNIKFDKVGSILQDSLEENVDNLDYEVLLKKLDVSLSKLGAPCNTILEYFYIKNYSMEVITNLFKYKNAETTKNLKYKCLKRLQLIFISY